MAQVYALPGSFSIELLPRFRHFALRLRTLPEAMELLVIATLLLYEKLLASYEGVLALWKSLKLDYYRDCAGTCSCRSCATAEFPARQPS